MGHRIKIVDKWYTSNKTIERFGHLHAYKQLDKHHEQVHVQAKYAVEAYNSGQIEKAESYLNEVEKASNEVLQYIHELVTYIDSERKS